MYFDRRILIGVSRDCRNLTIIYWILVGRQIEREKKKETDSFIYDANDHSQPTSNVNVINIKRFTYIAYMFSPLMWCRTLFQCILSTLFDEENRMLNVTDSHKNTKHVSSFTVISHALWLTLIVRGFFYRILYMG